MQYHRGPSRHESLLPEINSDESGQGWMVSYIDVMTLLVVLFVLIIALSGRLGGPGEAPASPLAGEAPSARLGVPLPAALRQAQARDVAPTPPSSLLPGAISAALGVAGPPPRSAPPEASPGLLTAAPPRPLPRLALPDGVMPEGPIADYMVILTDRLPAGVEAAPEAAGERLTLAAREVAEEVAMAPYLPDLEGVEVSRVPEGVRLRVEDRLLFPSAQAELTEAGRALVADRLRGMVARHAGEVAVQGHTDDRPIRTPRFPSNWALSSARAIAIVEALVEAGVDPGRLRAVGLADTRPLAANDTAEGRARNRRVEVVIQAR